MMSGSNLVSINEKRQKYNYILGSFNIYISGTNPMSQGMSLCNVFKESDTKGWIVCMIENLTKYQIHFDLKQLQDLKYPSMFFINCINDFMSIYKRNLEPFTDGVPAQIQKEVVQQILDDLNLKDVINE